MSKLQQRFERVAIERGYMSPDERGSPAPSTTIDTDIKPLELEPIDLKLEPIELKLEPCPDIDDILGDI